MIQPWAGGMEKYKAADSLILRLMDSIYAVNSDVEFSLRVFGHQHTVQENNCQDTRNEVPFSQDNRTQMAFRLADIRPLGVTPIAYALQQAAEYDLEDEAHNAYSIILITDGGESCGGDICEVMQKLIKKKVYFKPYIVSLENDPALRTTYSCMGDYLQVTRTVDIAPAVSTIVAAFRPVLKITKTDYKELQTIAASVPSVLKVNIPVRVTEPVDTVIPVKPQPKTVPAETEVITPVKTFPDTTVPKTVVIRKPPTPAPPTPVVPVVKPVPAVKEPPHDTLVVAPKPEPVKHHIVVSELPARPPAVKLATLEPASLRSFNIYAANAPKKAKLVDVPPLPPLVFDSVAAPLKLAHLKPALLKTFSIIFLTEDHIFNQRKVPALPPVNYDGLVKKIDSKIPIPNKQPVPPGKRGGYTVDAEDAKETSLAIYFTDGMGKFYPSTPQMVVIDSRTNKIIKKFYRTVDEGGNPDLQTNFPEGTYDIAVVGSRSLILHDVEIVKNKKNIVTITIKKSSLKFVYPPSADNRPVKEFIAKVTERDKPNGKVVFQKCTEELLYEPGNYHIDINTFPRDVRNVDLDLDDETVITILQPGFAKFTADAKTKVASLYRKDGDKFLPFYTLSLDDSTSQHLQIQPGEYQAHYHKGPGGSSVSEKVVPFIIKTTQETEVILK